jgi:hypothetical protein
MYAQIYHKSGAEVKEMEWIEVIKLRIAEKNPELVEQEIVKLISEVGNNGSMREIKLYHHAVVGNDLSVHVHWESGNAEPQGSATGLCLVHLLKEFGLISHSVWVEGK